MKPVKSISFVILVSVQHEPYPQLCQKMDTIVGGLAYTWATIGKKILIDHISVKKEDIEF